MRILVTGAAGFIGFHLCRELLAKGQSVEYKTILAEINARDEQDRTREISPAVAAKDAVDVDNSKMSIEENVAFIRALMEARGLL